MKCPFCKRDTDGVYIEESYTGCNHCGFDLNEPYMFEMNQHDLKTIVDFMNDQYISYENQALIKLVKEMRVWLEQQE